MNWLTEEKARQILGSVVKPISYRKSGLTNGATYELCKDFLSWFLPQSGNTK